jgi:hypothetical protein
MLAAAATAGAAEAFRLRHEPGSWVGKKGVRVASAALVAAALDAAVDDTSGEKTKRHLAEATVGGLVANRIAYGSSSRSRHY